MPEATRAAGGGVFGSTFDALSTDLTELILGRLPLPSILRASAVCKPWRSLISVPAFPSSPASPWFFLVGLHNTSSRNHQSFAFDPLSFSWFSLPSAFLDHGHDPSSSSLLIASSGFLFSTTPSFSFSRLFSPAWRLTSPLRFPRINPLLAVYDDSSSSTTSTPRFVVVGGVRFIGNLVDIEDRLAVEIYDPRSDSWDLCSPLPPDFRSAAADRSTAKLLAQGRLFVIMAEKKVESLYAVFLHDGNGHVEDEDEDDLEVEDDLEDEDENADLEVEDEDEDKNADLVDISAHFYAIYAVSVPDVDADAGSSLPPTKKLKPSSLLRPLATLSLGDFPSSMSFACLGSSIYMFGGWIWKDNLLSSQPPRFSYYSSCSIVSPSFSVHHGHYSSAYDDAGPEARGSSERASS